RAAVVGTVWSKPGSAKAERESKSPGKQLPLRDCSRVTSMEKLEPPRVVTKGRQSIATGAARSTPDVVRSPPGSCSNAQSVTLTNDPDSLELLPSLASGFGPQTLSRPGSKP